MEQQEGLLLQETAGSHQSEGECSSAGAEAPPPDAAAAVAIVTSNDGDRILEDVEHIRPAKKRQKKQTKRYFDDTET